jgi:hypothetical protein
MAIDREELQREQAPHAPGAQPDPQADESEDVTVTMDEADEIAGVHASDCARHNAPALPVGPCDCGVG